MTINQDTIADHGGAAVVWSVMTVLDEAMIAQAGHHPLDFGSVPHTLPPLPAVQPLLPLDPPQLSTPVGCDRLFRTLDRDLPPLTLLEPIRDCDWEPIHNQRSTNLVYLIAA